MLAAKQLGTKYPWLINLNCAAHAINNACKVHIGHRLNHRLLLVFSASAAAGFLSLCHCRT